MGGEYGNRTADTYLWTMMRCEGSEATLFDCPATDYAGTCTIEESAAVSVRERDIPPPAGQSIHLFTKVMKIYLFEKSIK